MGKPVRMASVMGMILTILTKAEKMLTSSERPSLPLPHLDVEAAVLI